jgi:predicted transcriptional regulator
MSKGSWGAPPPQGTQKRIYDFIEAHPGVHICKIARELGLGMGDLQYHLHALEDEGIIRTRRRGLYKFVFPSNMFGEKQETILSLLSQETPSEILLFLTQRPGSTQKDLVEHLKLAPASIFWHMDRMMKAGVIERSRTGKFVEYRLTVSADEIIRFVQHYHPTVWERWASRLADVFITMGSKERSNE